MAEKTAKPARTPRTEMPTQAPFARIQNYLEVALGYGEAEAMVEASRCLQCKTPLCRQGCPVEIDIKGFIGQLQKGDLPGAYKVLREYNSLPAVCGRVCPQENQCEGMCILSKNPVKTGGAVAIGRLERYVADTFAARLAAGDAACLQITGEAACRMTRDDLRVACIGAGPASLTVVGYLAALGVKVTVFEALHEVGGCWSTASRSSACPRTSFAARWTP
jgi:glutamate synthase (NADPH/NADH) small chain